MTTAPATTDADPKPTRERILDAAEVLFADRGFAGAAVRDIAGAVGLNAASLYNHFGGKDELYEAVLDRGLRPVFELLEQIRADGDNAENDLESVERLVRHFARNPQLARLIHHDSLAGGECLARIGGRWIGPIYLEGLRALRQATGDKTWEDAELPLLIAAFHNMILGYFALAPLMASVFGTDPLSDEALQLQSDFLKKVARRLVHGDG
ncbi:MAG: AcrR family transcriptional regulator [Hyphomicrobiaceae bacterium]|jgi:AcrR family transcriptional regulator